MRQRNPQNRRAYELTLTNAGREALSEAESAVEDAEEAVLAPLNEGGRMQLHKLLLSLVPDLGGPSQG
jgi:DNA-binding MarR family transcriptional regulator